MDKTLVFNNNNFKHARHVSMHVESRGSISSTVSSKASELLETIEDFFSCYS